MTTKHEDYREKVRRTFRQMSDRALDFQDARVIGGIDREELDAEIIRRVQLRREQGLALPECRS